MKIVNYKKGLEEKQKEVLNNLKKELNKKTNQD